MILRLRCDKASWLISESLDRKLLLHEWIALRGHQIACRGCPIVEKQLHLIRRATQHTALVRETTRRDASLSAITLSDAAKERLKATVRRVENS